MYFFCFFLLIIPFFFFCFFFSSRRRHTRSDRDWSSDVCSSDLTLTRPATSLIGARPLGWRASNSSTTRGRPWVMSSPATPPVWNVRIVSWVPGSPIDWAATVPRSEEHTSELQSRSDLVCRLLLEKKKKKELIIIKVIKKKYTKSI